MCRPALRDIIVLYLQTYTPMTDTLYSFRRCPYAMRARLALSLCLPAHHLELREVVLKDKPQAMLDISPKATVPVLLLENGQVIDESLDIMFWALEQNSELSEQLYPEALQTEIKNIIEQNDADFKWALDRYKYSDRFDESEEFYRKKAEVFLNLLNSMLQKQAFLFSDEITLGDLAVFPFVRQLAHVNKTWFYQSEYKQLINWLDGLLESDVFKSIMTKYSKWTPESETLYFPS